MTEVDCFKEQMEMREEEEAQVKAASKKNARLSSASKPRVYSVKRSSETEGHLYRTRLFTPFHSRVFKVFLTSSFAPRASCWPHRATASIITLLSQLQPQPAKLCNLVLRLPVYMLY